MFNSIHIRSYQKYHYYILSFIVLYQLLSIQFSSVYLIQIKLIAYSIRFYPQWIDQYYLIENVSRMIWERIAKLSP